MLIYLEIMFNALRIFGIERIMASPFIIDDWFFEMEEVLIDTRTIYWDLFIVAFGPTIVIATLIYSIIYDYPIANFVVDTEAHIAHKDRAAARVVLNDVENCGLTPLELVKYITYKVCNISVANIRVSPGNIYFSVRLGNSNIGRPLVNITVKVNGKVWED